MNYIKMIELVRVDSLHAVSTASFQSREALVDETVWKYPMIPLYLLIEAVFQNAGRLRRFVQGEDSGGVIVGMSGFQFFRPVFENEVLFFHASLLSASDNACYFDNRIVTDSQDIVLAGGKLIISKNERIDPSILNRNSKTDFQNEKKEFGLL